MKRKGDWLTRLAEGLELDTEPLPGMSIVEITGENRVLIEHHRGVSQYGKELICVKTKYGHIAVRGCGLEIARMTRQQVVICGKIDSVSLQRRGIQ